MRTRAEPLPAPEGPRVFTARVEGQDLARPYRVPVRRVAVRAVDALAAAHKAQDIDAVEAARGDLIRLCWADPTCVLDGADGQAVHDELWDAGWTPTQIAHVALGLVELIRRTFALDSEVATTVDFFSSSQMGDTAPTISISAYGISATHGASSG